MENLFLSKQLEQYDIKDGIGFINALREIAQNAILVSLSKQKFFDIASFYGGTCLRIFHNLPRYSEDLDFNLTKDIKSFSFQDYAPNISNYLNAYGLYNSFNVKNNIDKKVNTDVSTCFIKIDVNKVLNDSFKKNQFSFTYGHALAIKLELSTEIIKSASYEYRQLTFPTFANIKCFDFQSLFSSKICAVINRHYKYRVKGRDYFDYLFYINNGVKFNLAYVNEKIGKKNNVNINNIDIVKKMLSDKFKEVSCELIYKDLSSFVSYDFDFNSITNEILLSSLNLLKTI